jgi:hypothetical protein
VNEGEEVATDSASLGGDYGEDGIGADRGVDRASSRNQEIEGGGGGEKVGGNRRGRRH